MKIAIGCDEAALDLKNVLTKEIEALGHDPVDLGVYSDKPSIYADTAVKVAECVTSGRCERGVLLCGTGIGMSIMANKVPGIRAALAHDTYSAERAVKSNNAQIITMGARVIGPELAKAILRTFPRLELQGRSEHAQGRAYHAIRAVLPRVECRGSEERA